MKKRPKILTNNTSLASVNDRYFKDNHVCRFTTRNILNVHKLWRGFFPPLKNKLWRVVFYKRHQNYDRRTTTSFHLIDTHTYFTRVSFYYFKDINDLSFIHIERQHIVPAIRHVVSFPAKKKNKKNENKKTKVCQLRT